MTHAIAAAPTVFRKSLGERAASMCRTRTQLMESPQFVKAEERVAMARAVLMAEVRLKFRMWCAIVIMIRAHSLLESPQFICGSHLKSGTCGGTSCAHGRGEV